METSGRRIYDHNIIEKEAPEATGPSTNGGSSIASTVVDVKALLDDMLQKLLADNHIREDCIMEHMDMLANVREEKWLNVKEDILASKERLASQIEAMNNSYDYLGGNNFIFHHITAEVSILVSENLVVATALPPPFSDLQGKLYSFYNEKEVLCDTHQYA